MSEVGKLGKIDQCIAKAEDELESLITSSVENFILNGEQSIDVEGSVEVYSEARRAAVDECLFENLKGLDKIMKPRLRGLGMEGLFGMPSKAPIGPSGAGKTDMPMKVRAEIDARITEGELRLMDDMLKQARKDGLLVGPSKISKTEAMEMLYDGDSSSLSIAEQRLIRDILRHAEKEGLVDHSRD